MPKKPTHGLKLKWIKDASGKRIQVPEGSDVSVYQSPFQNGKWKLIPKLADQIVEFYLEGMSVRQIAEQPDMPPAKVIRHWMNPPENHHEKVAFAERMTAVRKNGRAASFEDELLDTARGVLGESTEEVAAARLKVDALKWAAEVNDPDVYGKKTKISGDRDNPLTLFVETGVPEPLPHQKAPELGQDGIVKRVEKIVEAEGVAESQCPQD